MSSTREIARQWFISGEGIDRHVISADIQRYLGNDATVRPGAGTGDNEGVQGYWIKAYRNLTNAMIADLRADSARWRQEQRVTGTREPYVGSSTYHASTAARQTDRRHGDSPSLGDPYGAPPSRDARERMPSSRMPVSDRMDIDPPSIPQPDVRDRRYTQPERGAYQPESRAYPVDSRYPPDSRSYQPEQPMSSAYGRPPVTSTYSQDPRYAPSYPQPSNDGAPPGYVRQGNYYVPIPGYEQAPAMPPSRSEPPQYGAGPYGQPPPSRDARGDPRDVRDVRGDPRDPRYGGQPEYADPRDPRYAYPSPAATVSSVSARDREPISSPPQPSPYGSVPSSSYDQYGRPVQYPAGQQPERTAIPPSRDPYGRDRAPVTTNTTGGDGHRSSRRRVG